MSALSTSTLEISQNGMTKEFTLPAYATATQPATLMSKTNLPTGAQKYVRSTFTLSFTTVDVDGKVLPERHSAKVEVTTAIYGDDTRKGQMVSVLQDLVQSSEFLDAVNGRLPLNV